MKKFSILLFVLCMLFGCASKQDKDDVYRCAKIMATGYIESTLGYDTNAAYELQKVKGEKDVFPYTYQVTKDDTPIFTIEFVYESEMTYGGVSFVYNDGYIVPYIQSERFLTYNDDRIEYSSSINEDMEYSEYSDVKFIGLEKSLSELVDEKLIDIDLEFCPGYVVGDKVVLYEPVKMLRISLNSETKGIEVSEYTNFDFPVYVNDELVSVLGLAFSEEYDSFGLGYDPLDDTYYQLLNGNQKFVRVVFGQLIDHQEVFVLEDGTIVTNRPYPLYVDRTIDVIKEYLANEESLQIYKEIK